jgi:hypothetical protein
VFVQPGGDLGPLIANFDVKIFASRPVKYVLWVASTAVRVFPPVLSRLGELSSEAESPLILIMKSKTIYSSNTWSPV